MNNVIAGQEISNPRRVWEPIENQQGSTAQHSIAVRPQRDILSPPQCISPGAEYHNPKYLKEHCKFAVIFVAEHFGVPISEVMSKTRAGANAATARQIAAYVAHTTLSISYAQVAEFFNRDRTTISHACKTIEDRRDDRCFDAKLCMVENLVGEAVNFKLICDEKFAPEHEPIHCSQEMVQ